MPVWTRLRRAGGLFLRIDGAQAAGALAYSAFASLFPTILLFLTAASFVIDPERAGRTVVGFMRSDIPMSAATRDLVFSTISGMAAARGRAGAAAFVVLVWTASQGFGTLVSVTNRAWGVAMDGWWRLPMKSLALLGIMGAAVPAAVAASTLARVAARFLPVRVREVESLLLPAAVELFALTLFYRFAPRRRTKFAEVWGAALVAALLLRAAENLFVFYLALAAGTNAVYGVFGDVTALLLWIYLSGCVFIYGACLCAAREEAAGPPVRGAATIP